jgi:predicted  nucleic acid-binding Zn-ribbon protein
MKNEDPFARTEALASTWKVEIGDISERVAAAIGASSPAEVDLARELRALRDEIRELRAESAQLRRELAAVRQSAAPRLPSPTRISPFAAGEGLVRPS